MFSPESFIIRRQCTPFCEVNCKYAGQHNKILVAVINCVDERGYNEFTKTVTKFTKHGWNIDDPIEDPDPEYQYPLVHWATVLGNVMVLKWCVEQGLDLNKRWGQRSETALHRLMVCGYSALRENSENLLNTFKKLVKLLKVLLHLKDDNKDLPIHVAAKVLVERPLINDSRFDRTYTEMLKILIQITCELDLELLNCRNIEGNTVMHIVAQHDKGAEILELLLDSGADCDLPNSESLKPIDIAKAKDATDIIAVLVNNDEDPNSSSSKNKEDLRADEIGDIEYIYIESDDDTDKSNNNDEKNEKYVRNLLDRVKNEPDDQNDLDEDSNTMDDTSDPDWNATNLDASSSNDTLFTMDEESYDIDGPFAVLNDARSTPTPNDFGESSSISKKDKQQGPSRPQTPDLKRKSSETETILVEPETKKLKGKESKMVSPKLEIQLNMPKFESLKRKIKEETTQGEKVAKNLFFVSSSLDLTIQEPENNSRFSPNYEVFVQQECCPIHKEETTSSNNAEEESHAVEIVSSDSSQEIEISPSVLPRTLPGMRADDIGQVHDQLTTSFSTIKEPLISKNMCPSRDEVPQIQFVDEEKVNCSQLSQLFDVLKPTGTRTERPLSTPNPLTIAHTSSPDSSRSAHEPTKQQLSSSSFQTVEHQRSSSSPVLSAQHHSTTSLPTEQLRSKKSIEDVVSNLKERQCRDFFESSSSTESLSTQEQVNGKQCNRTEQQTATTTSTQAENDSSSEEQSNNTVEKQGRLSQQEQLSRSSTPVTKNDEVHSERMFPSSEQQLSQDTKKPQSPVSNIVMKKEIDVSECGEKLLDSNTTPGQRSTSSLVRSQSREDEINKTATSVTKQLNEPSGISRNASPTQIQAGSYEAMNGTSTDTSGIGGGTSTDTSGIGSATSTGTSGIGSGTSTDRSGIGGGTFTDTSGIGSSTFTGTSGIGSGTSTDTSGIGSGTSIGISGIGGGTSTDRSGTGTAYQPLSSLTDEAEKLCKEVNNVTCSSSTTVNNVGKIDSKYDPLYSVLDKFCEEVYGISSGPQTYSDTLNKASKHGDCLQDNATQSQRPDNLMRSYLASTSTPVHEQESSPIQSTTTEQKQPAGELNIKIKQEPGLQNAQNEGQMMAQTHTPAVSQVMTGTTQEQMIFLQNQPTLLSATQPAQTIVQSPAQVPSLMLVSKQLVQTVGQDTTPTYIAVQSQAQPSQPHRTLTIQGSRPIQVATQRPSHATKPQLAVLQPQIQGQFIRLQHLPQTPQPQGTVRAQQPGVVTPGQGHIPMGQNRPALQNNPVLTRLLHQHFPGMINRLSRKPARHQNVNVGINQQSGTRPPTVMRPQISNAGEWSQSTPWNKQNLTQFPQKPGVKNGYPPPVYITKSNQLLSAKSAIQALTQSLNSKARQPTLEEAKRYLMRRSNVLQVRSNPLGPNIQRRILPQRPNQANHLAPQVQTANQARSLQPTTTQGDASVSVQVQTFTGRPIVSRVLGPDMETAMANRISKDPTNRTNNSSASVISVESPVNRSNVISSHPSGNALSDASSDVSVASKFETC